MRSRAVKIIIMIAITLCPVAGQCAGSTEEADLFIIKKAYNDGLYDLSLEKLENFLKSRPHTPYVYEVHLMMGRCFYYQNQPSKALYEFSVILGSPEASQFEDEALYWTGEIYFNSGDFKRAMEIYQEMIDRYPSSKYSSYSYYSKGYCCMELGYLEEAIASFKEVVKKFPYEKVAIDSQFRISECEHLLGRYDDALRDLELFSEKFPISDKTADGYYLTGEVLFLQARYSDSIEYFKKALSISSSRRWANLAAYRIAQAQFLLGEYAASLDGFKRSAESSGSAYLKSMSFIGMAKDHYALGMNETARALCDDIMVRFPKSGGAEAAYIKVKTLIAEGKYAEAETVANNALEKLSGPGYYGRLHYILGVSYARLGKRDAALEEFRWVKDNSKDEVLVASSLCEVGDLHMAALEHRSALENFDEVLNNYGGGPYADYAQYQIGNIFYRISRYDEAILAYRSLTANFPGTVFKKNILPPLAFSYFMSGNFERAAALFEELAADTKSAKRTLYRFYLANSLYNSARYDESMKIFKDLAKESSGGRMGELSKYQIGWCYHNLYKEADAAITFREFLKDYPLSEMANDARSWLGEHYKGEV